MTTRARVAVLEQSATPFLLQQLELGDVEPDEILVRIMASGICHTDLSVRDGFLPVALPVVLGHEGAGVVEQVGTAVSRLRPGDHVALAFASCGRCAQCQSARPTTCLEFLARNFACCRLDGTTALARDGRRIHSHFLGQSSFSTYAIVEERSAVKIDDDVPFEVAAPLGCGVGTGAGSVLNVLEPFPGSSVAIFGAGAVGLSAVMAAKIAGCSIIVAVDLNPARLVLARELGASHTFKAAGGDVVEAITDLTGGGVNFALEMSGSTTGFQQAVRSTGVRGVTAVVGAPPFGTEVSFDINIALAGNRSIRGVVAGENIPDVFIPRLVQFWREGRFPVEQLIQTFDFDQINAAVSGAEHGQTVKPVLMMQER